MTQVITICLSLLAATMILGFVRIFKGPGILNRILAFDLITISIIGCIGLYSILQETFYFFEIILAFCLLGFVSTMAFLDACYHSEEKDG